jgi:AcrR family transcriptional regulator
MSPPTTADRRSQLAVAAYEVVAESGIDRLSLRTVARRVGATTGLVSHHFVDRRDLLDAALRHAASTMLQRVLSLPPASDAFELLAAVLPTEAEAMQVWRFSLSVRTAGLFDPGLQHLDRRIRGYWAANLPDRLTGVAPGDRTEAAGHLVALVDGIALQAVLDPDTWPAARQLAHLRAGFLGIEAGTLGHAGVEPRSRQDAADRSG